MATVNIDLVHRQLRAIAATSKVIEKLLREALEKIEEDPTSFPRLAARPTPACVASRGVLSQGLFDPPKP
jgi:hypothetical protein